MKDEIKKVLDYLKQSINENEFDIELSREEVKQLLDYITILQKENERLKENAINNDKVVDKAKWKEMLYKSRFEKLKLEYESLHE